MLLNHSPMMTTILALYEQSLHDLTQALDPVSDADFAQPMGDIITHPAWTLSHLCGSAEAICQLLNDDTAKKADLHFSTFGPGSQPTSNRSSYLTKSALIASLSELHQRVTTTVQATDEQTLACPPPAPFANFAPTIGHIVLYLLTAHESYHLSLMLAWLRTWENQRWSA